MDSRYEKEYVKAFQGRWLVEPDADQTRGESTPGYDAGAYWGVALTAKGAIAVYCAHCNDGFPPQLDVYDDLQDALDHDVPENIIDGATVAMGGAVELDI